MQIWVDADACPKVIKEILFRAAQRVGVMTILVSNQYLRIPKSEFIKTIQVPGGFDVADQHIIDHAQAGDLVITADIPLAAKVVEKQAIAINPRGNLYTKENMGEILIMRNTMDELRNAGVETGGPAMFKHADREAFANQLDKFLIVYFKNK